VLAGRFGQAEALIAEGQAIGERAGDQGVTIFAQAVVNVMSYQQGRFAERAEPLGAFLRRFPALPVLRAVLTAALAVGGQADAARPELAALVADDLAALPRDLTFGYSLGLLAIACHALGERPAAERVQRLLLPYAERRPGDRTTRFGAGCIGPAGYYLGLLAATLGRWDEAVGHLERAEALNQRMGAAAVQADTRQRLAEALLARARPGDRERQGAGARPPGRPERPRGRGAAPGRRRPQQPGDRRGAVHQPQHRAAPRQQHPRQDRGRQPGGGSRLCHPPRPGLIAASCEPGGGLRRRNCCIQR